MLVELLIAAWLADGPAADEGPAAQHDVRLHWQGGECEGQRAVIERLGVLNPDLSITAADVPARLRVDALIERDQDGQWATSLTLASSHGRERRTFVAESCAVAIDATALVLAVAIDPVEVAVWIDEQRAVDPQHREPPSPSDPAEWTLEATPEPEPEPSPAELEFESWTAELTLAAAQADDVERSWSGRFGLAVLGGGGFGPLRAGSASVMARLAVIGPRWRADLRGGYLPPLSVPLADRGRARVEASWSGREVAVCCERVRSSCRCALGSKVGCFRLAFSRRFKTPRPLVSRTWA